MSAPEMLTQRHETVRNQWHKALEVGDAKTAKQLYDKNINLILDEDTCPLMDAASAGFFDLCEWLILKRDEPVCWKNRWGWSALTTAASKGDVGVCELLLKHGAKIQRGGVDDHVVQAVKNGHIDLCRLFIENGAKIYPKKGQELKEAAALGNMEICELFLNNMSNINCDKAHAAFFIAASEGHLDLCKLFVAKGINQEAKGEALISAIDAGELDIQKYLKSLD